MTDAMAGSRDGTSGLCSVASRAAAATGVHPVALHEEIEAAALEVVDATVRTRRGAPRPCALVGVLVPTTIEPGIAHVVGRRLLDLVRECIDFGVRGDVRVRRRELRRAAADV